MAFQVLVRMNKNKVEVLSVASSSYEFQKFTIKKLKSIALILFPGVDGRLFLFLPTISTFIDMGIENQLF